MINNEELKSVFEDTKKQFMSGETLKMATSRLKKETCLYPENFCASVHRKRSDYSGISVIEDTSFHAASGFCSGTDKVAVLNFANPHEPGGGVTRGVMAQEESLCRSSNLYASLTTPGMLENYYKWNRENAGREFSDRIIYSPGVTVFKSDDTYPVNLETCFQVDVITCAAPYISNAPYGSWRALKDIFYKRIKNILEVALERRGDVLILGAFGCGAFRNPPELVAGVFRRLLVEEEYEKYFKKIVFAVKAEKDRMSDNFLIYNLILSWNPAENEEILEENVNRDMIEVLWCAEEWPELRTDEKFMKNLTEPDDKKVWISPVALEDGKQSVLVIHQKREPEKSYGIKYDVPPRKLMTTARFDLILGFPMCARYMFAIPKGFEGERKAVKITLKHKEE